MSSSNVAPWECAPGRPGTKPTNEPVSGHRSAAQSIGLGGCGGVGVAGLQRSGVSGPAPRRGELSGGGESAKSAGRYRSSRSWTVKSRRSLSTGGLWRPWRRKDLFRGRGSDDVAKENWECNAASERRRANPSQPSARLVCSTALASQPQLARFARASGSQKEEVKRMGGHKYLRSTEQGSATSTAGPVGLSERCEDQLPRANTKNLVACRDACLCPPDQI